MTQMAATSSGRLFSQTIVIVLARVGGVFAGFSALLMTARFLGADEMATVSVAISLAMLLSVACTMNFEAGGVRFLLPYLQQQNFCAARGYISFGKRFSLGMSLLTCIITLYVLRSLHLDSPAFDLAILTAPILGYIRLNSGMAMGFSFPVLAVLPRTFLRPFIFCLLIYLVYCLSYPPSTALEVMFLFTISCVFVALVQGLCCSKLVRHIPHVFPPDTAAHKEWVQKGFTLGVNVLYLEYGAAIAILCAAFTLPASDVARFDIALRIIGFIRFGQVAINQALLPSLSRAITANDSDDIHRLLRFAAQLRLLALLLGCLVIFSFEDRILRAFGPEFANLGPIILVLMAEIVSITLFGPAANVISLSQAPEILSKSFVITFFILIASSIGFSYMWGLQGAAMGYVYARLTWDFTLSRSARRITGISPSISILFPPNHTAEVVK